MYGNINSTVGGAFYSKPDIRYPGSGGAGAMAANCERTIVIMALEERRFPKRLNLILFPHTHPLILYPFPRENTLSEWMLYT
jgi:acyl CoA:acetate/3-ketoacid CoA transferase beta subunit